MDTVENSRRHAQYSSIARFKGLDVMLQLACFIFMVIAMMQEYFWSFVVMAGIQCISAIVWAIVFAGDTRRQGGGTFIRRVFMIVMGLLALVALTREGSLIMITAYAMLIVGPVCGLSYFIITMIEMSFYRKLSRLHTKETA